MSVGVRVLSVGGGWGCIWVGEGVFCLLFIFVFVCVFVGF